MTDDKERTERAKELDRHPESAASLPDDELEQELTVSAAAPGRGRFSRFVMLLIERSRRRAGPRRG